MRGRFSARPFFLSFFATLLVLLFVIGLFAVDSAGRRLSFNDTDPPFEIVYGADGRATLTVHAFSLDRSFDFTGPMRVWRFFADFFCLPRR